MSDDDLLHPVMRERLTFTEPLRRYRDFAVWPDGAISPPFMTSWEDADDLPFDDAIEAAYALLREHPAPGPCGEHCEGTHCRGWDLFDTSGPRGVEVERDDQCAKFADDDAALADAILFFDAHAPRSVW